MAKPPKVTADPHEFEEAVAYWRSKVPVSDDDFDELSEEVQAHAFKVADVTDLQILADVWHALDSAIAKGTTFEDFQAEVGAKLEEAWGGEDAWRAEVVFRQNVMQALNAGRYAQQQDPDVKERRPLAEFSAILDGRTTEICRHCNGTVLPADDPWWMTHEPGLHMLCRSTKILLTEEEGAARITAKPTSIQPDDGFGTPPAINSWVPDLSNVPEPLRAAYHARKKADQ